jgi:hypothetical protein
MMSYLFLMENMMINQLWSSYFLDKHHISNNLNALYAYKSGLITNLKQTRIHGEFVDRLPQFAMYSIAASLPKHPFGSSFGAK